MLRKGEKNMELGNKIIELRQGRGITTNKLANLAGISQSYLREVEMGKKNPTVEVLSDICFGLNISLQEFFASDEGDINIFLKSAIKKLSESEQIKLAEFINEIKK